MKKSIVAIVLAMLVVAGGVVIAVMKFSGESSAMKAGECVAVANHNEDRADVTTTACGSDKAVFKVGKILTEAAGNCPDVVDEYTSVVPNAGGGKLCLLPNFLEGGCYKPDDTDDSWGKSSCAGEDTVKVTKVLSGVTDGTGCPDSETGQDMAFPEPPITYCLSPVKP
ncbi:hypothetical protein JOF56_010847 [Kibdelosporangium banguiense]|uniref:Secreted protein n=1 Tax=Kibdelosporangium banguiense TaxID=1365924 RepID=A0ABS4U1D5_9PSEU|nr:hypothetical protein [Kibdelosporangium banguiense]MBP2330462.1 hypothetical protein [Kibdelosporangium banguiense]